MDWLEDECVTRHLSDSRHVARFIEQVIDRVQLPILTHLFNQGGGSSWSATSMTGQWGSCARHGGTGLRDGPGDRRPRQLGPSARSQRHPGSFMKRAFFEMRSGSSPRFTGTTCVR